MTCCASALGLTRSIRVRARHALPPVVVARPGGDAVDVRGQLHLGQVGELAPFQRRRVLDRAVDEQPPGMESGSRAGCRDRAPASSRPRRWPGGRRSRMRRRLAGQQPAVGRPLLLAVDQLVLELPEQGDVVVGHALSCSCSSTQVGSDGDDVKQVPVVLSEAKDLTPTPKNAAGRSARSFAALRMTEAGGTSINRSASDAAPRLLPIGGAELALEDLAEVLARQAGASSTTFGTL